MSIDPYPTDEELGEILRQTDTPQDLLERINALWWHDGFSVEHGDGVKTCHLSTWGWSGNESIVAVLKRTWFWFFFWESSRRGGHYTFEIPEPQWKMALPEPLPLWLESVA